MLNNIASPTYATASITRDSALSLIVAARHAARDLGINVAIAVTDAGGHLTAFERADATYARGEPILRMTGVDGQHASAGFALP